MWVTLLPFDFTAESVSSQSVSTGREIYLWSMFGFKAQGQTGYGCSLHRTPDGSKISKLIFKATICSYDDFVLIRNMCHLGADKLQRSVHSSGTMRKIFLFSGILELYQGSWRMNFSPHLFPLSWVPLCRVQPALPNSICWPCLSYLVVRSGR